ncbi:MAG TPA: sigma-70 family RNA polymerase sigma factor, partial [Nannocystaceae bacterium]|nr:sigma-70 family RNA polymerase sigma factor [Nannocystaceae bacterium]
HREVSCCLVRLAAAQHRDPRQDAGDLVHEVVVLLLASGGRELRRWDPQRGRSLESYVRLLARRKVTRLLRQRRGNPWACAATDPTAIEADDDGAGEQQLETCSELRRVLAALDPHMSARDHMLFRMVFVEERHRDEVAAALHMTRGAIDAWCYRMRRLARALASGGAG